MDSPPRSESEAPGQGAGRSGLTVAPPPGRRPYRAPRLDCFGRVAEMTRLGGSQIVDSGSGSFGNQA